MNTRARFAEIVRDHFDVPENSLTDDTDFVVDLGADSLDFVEIVMAVELQMGVVVPFDAVEIFTSFGECAKLVERVHLKSKSF